MNISLFFLINILLFNYWCQISDQTNLLLTPFDKNSLLTDCSAQFCSTFCWTVLYWEVRISFYTTQKCVMTSQFSFILIRSSYLPTWGTPWRKKDWHSYWRKWYFWCWIHHHQKKKKRSVLKDMSIFISIGKYTIRASLTKNIDHVCNNKIIKLKDYACLTGRGQICIRISN